MILPKASDLKFITRLPLDTDRVSRIQALRDYYTNFVVEDVQNGTDFDCHILNLLDGLEKHYKGKDG